jgi:curved DNA-binding protein CbpA
MKNRRNYYRILHVQPDAPAEVIRASYRTLMRELKKHPDLGGASSEASLLNEAYAVLANPEARTLYDKVLSAVYTKRYASKDKRPLTTVSCPFCGKALARELQGGNQDVDGDACLQPQKPTRLNNECQRALPRVKRADRISYYSSSSPGKALQGRMVDFSPKGLRFLSSERLARGSMLKIRGPFFDASAQVNNVRQKEIEGRTFFEVGVIFVAINFQQLSGAFLSTSA